MGTKVKVSKVLITAGASGIGKAMAKSFEVNGLYFKMRCHWPNEIFSYRVRVL